jgi:thiosulfate/3-mercaptopyruvate sulfurtransferase
MQHRFIWLITALAAAALAACTAYAQGGTAPAVPSTGALVSTEWLAQHLENPDIRIVEVSVDPGAYARGHVPGAVSFVWHTDLVDTVRRDIATPDRFQERVRAAGIDDDTTVVLYGDNNNWFAAWGAWVFHLYGFGDVRLLDGGRVKWEAEGRPMSLDVPSYPAGTATLGPMRNELRAYLPDVLALVGGQTNGILLDIRSPAEFNGELFAPAGVPELSVRAGHIPGALNVPWGQNVNQDGTFKSVDELRALYAELGVDGRQPVVTYCRIGERAALTWFVLTRLLGYEAALYDGSWTEYGNSVGVPIENPAGTIWGKQ